MCQLGSLPHRLSVLPIPPEPRCSPPIAASSASAGRSPRASGVGAPAEERQANWCQCSRWKSGRRERSATTFHPESWVAELIRCVHVAGRRASGPGNGSPIAGAPRHYPPVSSKVAGATRRVRNAWRKSGSDGARNPARTLWRQGLLKTRRWMHRGLPAVETALRRPVEGAGWPIKTHRYHPPRPPPGGRGKTSIGESTKMPSACRFVRHQAAPGRREGCPGIADREGDL